jgi:hypothetical protein
MCHLRIPWILVRVFRDGVVVMPQSMGLLFHEKFSMVSLYETIMLLEAEALMALLQM